MNAPAPILDLPREFYTRQEVAALFRRSLRTIDEWIAQGHVTVFRKAGHVLFHRDALRQFYLQHVIQARHRAAPVPLTQYNPEEQALIRDLFRDLVTPIIEETLARQSAA